jgi:RsiW-degrading membrane proteinase PrsW (M82 family)
LLETIGIGGRKGFGRDRRRTSAQVDSVHSSKGNIMRIFVILMLIAIIASLASALVFVYRDRGQDKTRAVKALTLRVGLSLVLFVLLMAAYRFGWIGERL